MTKKLTNREALEAAVVLAKAAQMPELTAKLQHMYEQACKVRPKAPRVNKTRAANLGSARELVIALDGSNKTFGTDYVMEHVKYITSPQKAAAVIKVAVAEGWVVKVEPVKGKARYKLA